MTCIDDMGQNQYGQSPERQVAELYLIVNHDACERWSTYFKDGYVPSLKIG